MTALYIAIGIIAVALIGAAIWWAVKNNASMKQRAAERRALAQKAEEERRALAQRQLEEVQQKHSSFITAIGDLKGLGFVCAADLARFKETWKPVQQELKAAKFPQKSEAYGLIQDFLRIYSSLDQTFEAWNREFVQNEKVRCKELLANIDGRSLDEQQQNVVVYDEDNTLVLAGAGSGKTLTIAAKVKYLCSEKKVSPADILLISFTRKAAEEMTDRISKRLGIPIAATTFHKLGLDILKASSGQSIDVLEDTSDFVNSYFENELMKQPETVKLLLEYFAYYLHIPADMEKFDSLGDAYAYERGMDFETFKSKYDAQTISHAAAENRENKQTLHGERVKSLEEVSIANFLFLNGVKYEYEAKYPFQSSDASFKVYRPDFYLPDYDIYLEHFGVNKQGRLPWLSRVEEQKYLEGMAWKREHHKANGTKLLETYSYYSSEGVLLEKLEEMLRQNGVELKEVDYQEVFNAIYKTQSDAYFSEFKKLCNTFLVLYKSNGLRNEALGGLSQRQSLRNAYFNRRVDLFLSLLKPLLEAYDSFLEANGMIDFSDMINKAAEAVRNGFAVKPYRYVVIDEYQDISVARHRLVRAILDQTHAKLLCVGDDWQSIYRFAGSDISLFTDFHKNYAGKSLVLKLERTYRNSQELIDAAGKFVMSNPRQMKKQLVSSKSIEQPITFWLYDDNPFVALGRAIDTILLRFDKKQSILLLGRTNYDATMLESSGLFLERKNRSSDRYVYAKSPETPISFMTVHKAKGLEADNVILLNFQNSTLGFPNKIADDPMLELVLSQADNFAYGEERRLFYVAMTRTKNRLIVLTDSFKPSVFFDELKESPSATVYRGDSEETAEAVDCPRCKKGRLVVRKNEETNRYFLGCSNYPQCDYTFNDVRALENPHKCPACGGFMVERNGQFGKFYGCSNYPHCRHTEELDDDSSQTRRIGF